MISCEFESNIISHKSDGGIMKWQTLTKVNHKPQIVEQIVELSKVKGKK